MRVVLISYLLLCCYLSGATELAKDELLLASCQGNGHELYQGCVLTPPVKPEQVATCVTLKATYILCLVALNKPLLLDPALVPDPYAPNPFSPCAFATGHMIMWDICPN